MPTTISAEGKQLHPLGKGAYNSVYADRNPKGSPLPTWIYKTIIPSKDPLSSKALDERERAIRLFNELNPNLPADKKASLVEVVINGATHLAWRAPYLGSTQASDGQIAQALIDIYRDKRRIVLDGCGSGNFLRFNGKTYLVDVGFALRLQGESEAKGRRRRRSSIASANFQRDNNLEYMFGTYIAQTRLGRGYSYWDDYSLHVGRPLSVEITRNLFFLTKRLSADDILDKHIRYTVIRSLTLIRSSRPELISSSLLDLMAALDEQGKLSTACSSIASLESLAEIARLVNVHRITLTTEATAAIADIARTTAKSRLKDLDWWHITSQRQEADKLFVASRLQARFHGWKARTLFHALQEKDTSTTPKTGELSSRLPSVEPDSTLPQSPEAGGIDDDDDDESTPDVSSLPPTAKTPIAATVNSPKQENLTTYQRMAHWYQELHPVIKASLIGLAAGLVIGGIASAIIFSGGGSLAAILFMAVIPSASIGTLIGASTGFFSVANGDNESAALAPTLSYTPTR